MKKATTLLCYVLSLASFAQTKDIVGTYVDEQQKGYDYQLRINEDKTFEMLVSMGSYHFDENGNVILDLKTTSVFTVEKSDNPKPAEFSDVLAVTLSSSYIISDIKYLYIGYEEAGGEVQYLNAYQYFDQKGYDMLSPPDNQRWTITIPKTNKLYLVANKNVSSYATNSSNDVIVETFLIGKKTDAVDVTFNWATMSAKKMRLVGTFDKEKHSLTIKDETKPEGIATVFVNEKHLPNREGFEVITSENITDWEHLVSTVEDATQGANASESTPSVKVEVKTSIKDALTAAKWENKTIIAFYQPNNTNAQKEFDALIKRYEQELSYYSTYGSYSNFDKLELYLLNDNDKKWIKKQQLPQKNIVLGVSEDGDIIYQGEDKITDLSSAMYDNSRFVIDIQQANLAKRLDVVFNNNKATVAEIQEIFRPLLVNYYYEPFYRNYAGYKGDDTSDYGYTTLKNPENLYKFTTTPEKTQENWAKMIQAHQKDKTLDIGFVGLLNKNYFDYGLGYLKIIYNIDDNTNYRADLDAFSYLLRFDDEITDYINNSDYETKEKSGLSYYSPNYKIEDVLNQIAKTKPDLRNEVKAMFLEAEQKNRISQYQSQNFFKTYYPEEYIDNFRAYYHKMTSANDNLILSLDKNYTDTFSKIVEQSWINYKNNFANDCNSTAWQIVTDRSKDKAILEEAIKWSHTSLELVPNSAYFMDTLAHLLYLNGEHEKAIVTQRKAVELLKKDQNDYCCGDIESDMHQALKDMENGTFE